MKDPYKIVKRQLISEKANMLMNLKDRESNKSLKRFKKSKYVFLVDKKANKKEIKPPDFQAGTFVLDESRDMDRFRGKKSKKRKGWKEEARKFRRKR